MTSEEREELIEKRNNIGGDGMNRIIINSAGYLVWEGTNIIVGKQSRREKMTIEEIETRIKKVEKIKAFLEKGRDEWLDSRTWDDIREESLCGYLSAVRDIEACERELKRLGTEEVHLIIGKPPYDGDEE